MKKHGLCVQELGSDIESKKKVGGGKLGGGGVREVCDFLIQLSYTLNLYNSALKSAHFRRWGA